MTSLMMAQTLGPPRLAGALAVYPVFGPEPRLEYLSLAGATGLGAFVKEHDAGAQVREVIVENPTDLPFLIYEGQQIKGAQQNRSVDSSILVPAKSRVPAPVSCIERGRWDQSRRDARFGVSEYTGDPALRASKHAHARRPGAGGRPDQQQVWADVNTRLDRFGVPSGTDSLEDLFASRADRFAQLSDTLSPLGGQVGALALISGRPVALDLVSRPDVFAELSPALASGYLMQAEDAEPKQPDDELAKLALMRALAATREPAARSGLGHAFTISAGATVGAGLNYDGELIALSAFPGESATW